MIEVRSAKGLGKISVRWIKKVISRTLESEKAKRRSVTVLLTNDQEIRRLNKRYLRHDRATDVISFWLEENSLTRTEADYLGDVALSVEMAGRTAKRMGIPFREELARYLVHGVLHLLGYQDENPRDKKVMEERQERLLCLIAPFSKA
ncbi:MAG: rRNA maturation RNase YbeY [Candidatus Omnitrophica bacterium]|nr:rRNA maturation RNase YbeY [Candidatus Omnitrophota bacterium]